MRSVAFLDANRLAVARKHPRSDGASNDVVLLYDTRGPKVPQQKLSTVGKSNTEAWSLRHDPRTNLLACVSPRAATVFDMRAGKVLHAFSMAYATQLALEGHTLAVGTSEPAVRVFDLHTGQRTNVLRTHKYICALTRIAAAFLQIVIVCLFERVVYSCVCSDCSLRLMRLCFADRTCRRLRWTGTALSRATPTARCT